jgi:hypothetical protein
MPHHNQSFCVGLKAGALLPHVTIRRSDIGKSSGPTATVVPHAAIFHVEGRDACIAQGMAKMSGVGQVILSAPEAAVQID